MVDASVALSWVLPGELQPVVDALRGLAAQEQGLALWVPPIFWPEVCNALCTAVRRERLQRNTALAALEALMDFRFETWSPDLGGCLSCAVDLGIAAYDASYIQVCLESGGALWTIDRPLWHAAASIGIATEPEL